MCVTIRRATIDDAKQISELIVPLTKKYVCPTWEQDAHHVVLESMSAENVASYIANDYYYLIAEDEHQSVIGVACMRDFSHLYHLFVAEKHQGKGVSRLLWQRLKSVSLKQGNQGRFTVNAAINSEQVYAKFGFKRTQGVRKRRGMVDVPMELTVADKVI
ncbi:GNAT family N-acetyltransferase [Vibrio panuliri]|uniref:GNAT family N-acetyltransferase n=1 Tax=Vibrio panuliri TaxID=1381081 RepID=A0A1Q9HJ42_9VIBR|nr:GNAT family N-acetyltransferase [Vibrio panuliri]OLQ90300.1 GNAT family N-acetyltransferase [Vibrio panuliri]